jgi:triosephosphate isomerase
LCVGEHTRDDGGAYFKEVSEQLRHSLAGFPRVETKRLVIAYEPIWAIGSKALRPATPADFHEMSILIRRHLVEQFGKAAGFKIPILYGGSVDERNALGFLKDGGADGLLVGRVSLNSEQFGAIIKVAESIK